MSSNEIDLSPYIDALCGAKDERAIEFVLRQLLKDYSFVPVRSHPHSHSNPRKRKQQEEEPEEEPEEQEPRYVPDEEELEL